MKTNYSHIIKSFTVMFNNIAKRSVRSYKWGNCQRCRENVYVE